jgi:hypothetical protein
LKVAALLALLAASLGCTTYFIATVSNATPASEARKALSQCLREQGLVPCMEQTHESYRRSCEPSLRRDSTLREEWFGDALYVGVHETDLGLTARFLATVTFDKLAAEGASRLKECAAHLEPPLPVVVESRTLFPDLR